MKVIDMKDAIELKKPAGNGAGGFARFRASDHVQAFMNGVKESANTPAIPTGFEELDRVLDGGLYAGLYCVGAISSLGKTTFVMQIADQVAQQGQDVIFFSLEMSRYELMAKSISRTTFLIADEKREAKTVRGISVGARYKTYTQKETELIKQSVFEYSEYGKNIYIVEGDAGITADKIRGLVKEYTEETGKTPIVIIDYLQLIAPHSERATDKQAIDRSVSELKRISRDYKAPVIAISSLNRQSYKDEANMAAFKESGAIEYSSDVLIGMQLKGAGGNNFDVDAAKKKDPREVEVVILKNRNGKTGAKLDYRYYAAFNFFEEAGKSKEAARKRI